MKKLFKSLLVFTMFITLSGCQLASKQENAYVDPIQIGYFITTYHLPGNKIVGERIGNNFVFGNEKGYSVFEYYDPTPTKVDHVIRQIDPAISDYVSYSGLDAKAKARFTNVSKDQSDFYETVLFTIYFDAPQINYIYHNKVYEDYQGNIFVVPTAGTGFSLDDKAYIGNKGTIFETTTHPTCLTGGEMVQMTIYTEIQIATKARIDYYLVHQIDKNQELVSTTKILGNEICDEILKENDMEYIILEAYTTSNNTVSIERKMVDRSAMEIEVYKVNDNGIFESVRIPLK